MENQDLIKRIQELEKWKAERERQQITFPLDFPSIDILSKYFMHITNEVKTISPTSGNTLTSYIGIQGNYQFNVEQNIFVPYTVNTTSDVLTVTGKYYFEDNQQVYVTTEDTAPSPLVPGTTYFVINSTGQSFKLSLTSGGAAINITTSGTGKQYIFFL